MKQKACEMSSTSDAEYMGQAGSSINDCLRERNSEARRSSVYPTQSTAVHAKEYFGSGSDFGGTCIEEDIISAMHEKLLESSSKRRRSDDGQYSTHA